jgi:hypothetical protein
MGKGMKAGKRPGGSGGGGQGAMQKQVQQMQAMQRKMDELQSELDQKEVTATAGGGAISVTANGKRELVKIESVFLLLFIFPHKLSSVHG